MTKYTKIFLGLIMAVFMAFGINCERINAADSNCKVHDLDDSLTDSQEEKLNKKIAKASDKIDANVAVVITSDLGYSGSDTYATRTYDEMFGNEDGLLLLIDNDTHYDWIAPSVGFENKYNRYIERFFDDITPELQRDDYEGAIEAFVDNVDLANYKKERILKYVVIGLIVALVVSLITCLAIAHSYKTLKKYEARNYEAKESTRFNRKEDRFLREYTTKTKIESNSGGGSRSGGGGGSRGGGRRR
ncbi:MAG: TPM domain-containing protein [Ruminococcus sp.]|nr:TPM domain-containing protein [Ruminococcus sp.]